MIDSSLPKNWKDLQDKVAEIFTDIGYKAVVGKDIQTVRGVVRVDVFAVDKGQLPNIVYLCECKHWERRIPKGVVHSFRTVVQDSGANCGIVISKRGFQRGAYEAAKSTSIELVDWFAFQNLFEEKWLPAISSKIYEELQTLVDCTETFIIDYFPAYIRKKLEELNPDKAVIQELGMLRRKYAEIGMRIVSLRFGPTLGIRVKLPLVLKVPTGNQDKSGSKKISSWREYINFLMLYGRKGLKEFNRLFKEAEKRSQRKRNK